VPRYSPTAVILLDANADLNSCGAGLRLSVYVLSPSYNSSSSLVSSTSASSSSGLSATSKTSIQTTTISLTSVSTSETSSPATPSPTGPIHVSSVGAYKWIGCYTEASNTRALNSATLVNYTAMTGQYHFNSHE
jgi:hypothetical protein